jgi:hypothetical protein
MEEGGSLVELCEVSKYVCGLLECWGGAARCQRHSMPIACADTAYACVLCLVREGHEGDGA